MKEFFIDLFKYNHLQNQTLLHSFETHQSRISDRCLDLFSHLILAHHTWNSRILEIPSKSGIWETLSPGELEPLEKDNFNNSISIIRDNDLENHITYKNSRGQHFANSIREILFHVINHSTYHRGQIALQFRDLGVDPVVTDYIVYKRS